MGIEESFAAIKGEISQFEADFRPLTQKERGHFFNVQAVRRFRQSARVRSLSSASKKVVGALLGKGLYFGLTPPNKAFIVASHPVLKIIPTGASKELNDPMVEAWLPIHPNIVLAFAGSEFQQIIVQLTEKHVRDYNIVVARRSTEFASTSLALVNSIKRHCGLHRG
ncbi:hypothetical protein [Ancylobacter defluvii]|uniref:Uncharacterized protein n=1 Tax=Ancylobacter defluvii TaxID=1282440 RepID=A0A9W6K0P0_9HYPH|nr:hypothetical protein [Ancylobacter defluvii]MBS7586728.1 hypothetical protein [Ancylobacter defluvii]GLK86028.1 hypothetical protein GCM10017653_40980 [Ancylobacter defluvii]